MKTKKGAARTVVSSLLYHGNLRINDRLSLVDCRAVIFLVSLFSRIVFCVVRIPKKYLGNRPSDFGSANDNGGQKAEQSNNSIQNIHDGVPPSSLSCINDQDHPEDDKNWTSSGRHTECDAEEGA